jgi:hypothetical protein
VRSGDGCNRHFRPQTPIADLKFGCMKVTRCHCEKVRLPLWVRRLTEAGRIPAERLRLPVDSLPSGDGL